MRALYIVDTLYSAYDIIRILYYFLECVTACIPCICHCLLWNSRTCYNTVLIFTLIGHHMMFYVRISFYLWSNTNHKNFGLFSQLNKSFRPVGFYNKRYSLPTVWFIIIRAGVAVFPTIFRLVIEENLDS